MGQTTDSVYRFTFALWGQTTCTAMYSITFLIVKTNFPFVFSIRTLIEYDNTTNTTYINIGYLNPYMNLIVPDTNGIILNYMPKYPADIL